MIHRLSSYLYSVTSNTTYSSAAQLAAEFIWSHLYNGSIILDDIALAGCKNVNYNDFLSYNSGLTIEALAAIATWNNSWVPRCAGSPIVNPLNTALTISFSD